jgi:protein-S-isoprenylcysteine O-methyltransferase Ste14
LTDEQLIDAAQCIGSYNCINWVPDGLGSNSKPSMRYGKEGAMIETPATEAHPPESVLPRLLALAYGVLSYLIFFGVFWYSIGFVGNLVFPKTIDSGPQVPLGEALAVDLLLLGLFAVQHSVMARPGFKQVWTRWVPEPVERSTYVLLSSLLLALLFWQWRPIRGTVWEADHPVVVGALWGLCATGWLITLISTFLIDHFDLFGLRQVYLFATRRPYSPPPFSITLLYRVVRHPLLLGFLIAFWATPAMTWGHLLFAGMMTVYILIAIPLEERDLRMALKDSYEQYRQQVSMIVPWIKRGQRA